MIEFANFAKCYQSPKNVEEAYDAYLKGIRVVNNGDDSIFMKILKADKVFFNGDVIKDKYNKNLNNDTSLLSSIREKNNVIIESWNNKSKVLILKNK
jgi:hypothetical protein